jgi:hypothetical protein
MLFFTLKTIFISLLLITLIHYLYSFFKNTLTIPKVKDLVNKPTKRYNDMFDMVQKSGEKMNKYDGLGQEQVQVQGHVHVQGQVQAPSMQDELKNFLKELKRPDTKTASSLGNNFPAANDMSNGSYASF